MLVKQSLLKNLCLTGLSLLAFAANSVLCRLALADGSIDAAGFTMICLCAGALVLYEIWYVLRQAGCTWPQMRASGSWYAAIMLLSYAAAFSFLGTVSGALILFAFVQMTMIGWRLLRPWQVWSIC